MSGVRPSRSAIIAGLVIVAVYLLRLDRTAGLIGDDAIYVELGRALARGDGFQLTHAPGAGLLPWYPPGFPLLLAPIFWWAPSFPANVFALKAISVAAMWVASVLLYGDVRRRGWSSEMALLAAMTVVLVPGLVFLATSTVMSECTFLLAQIAAVVVLERASSRAGTCAAAALSACAVAIRTAGLGVPIGALAWFVHRRQWWRAALFAGTFALLLAPWQLYAQSGDRATPYSSHFWMRRAGDPSAGTITARELPARVFGNVREVVTADLIGVVAPALLRGSAESGQEVIAIGHGVTPGSMGNAMATVAMSIVLALLMGLGFWRAVQRGAGAVEWIVPASLAIICLWPFSTFRFVLPLAPFLIVYLIEGLQALPRRAVRVPALALLSVLSLSLLDHAGYLAVRATGRPDWTVDAADTDAVLDWLQAHPGDGVIASTNPALVYLRTGQSAVSLDDARAAQARFTVCLFSGVPAPSGARLRYRSPERGFWITEP